MRVFGCFIVLATAWPWSLPVHAQYGGGAIVRCQSLDFRDNYCPVNTRAGVVLVRQISRAPCYEGETWGYDRRGIWVTGGCDAEFQLRGGHSQGSRQGYGADPRYGVPPPGAYPPPAPPAHGDGYGHGQARGQGGGRVVCESRDYRYNYCPVPVRRDVDLVTQYSKSPCRFQATWGFDRGGVWVDRGCAAEFVVY